MATFEKVTPVTEDEADDIRVTLELDEGEVECEILTIFEANNRDYIALMPCPCLSAGRTSRNRHW